MFKGIPLPKEERGRVKREQEKIQIITYQNLSDVDVLPSLYRHQKNYVSPFQNLINWCEHHRGSLTPFYFRFYRISMISEAIPVFSQIQCDTFYF